jgi:hypothetical protein
LSNVAFSNYKRDIDAATIKDIVGSVFDELKDNCGVSLETTYNPPISMVGFLGSNAEFSMISEGYIVSSGTIESLIDNSKERFQEMVAGGKEPESEIDM